MRISIQDAVPANAVQLRIKSNQWYSTSDPTPSQRRSNVESKSIQFGATKLQLLAQALYFHNTSIILLVGRIGCFEIPYQLTTFLCKVIKLNNHFVYSNQIFVYIDLFWI